MKRRPKIRKFDSKKRKRERNEVLERVQKQTAAILDHPMECCLCKTPFERTQETVLTWNVTVKDERVRLTCPTCWSTVQKFLENKND